MTKYLTFLILRKPLCWMHLCPFMQRDDEDGIWGECIYCGKRAGYVSRAELRAYADRSIAQHQSKRAPQEAGR